MPAIITDFSLTSTLSYSHEVAAYEWKLELLVVNCPKTDLQEKKNRKSKSFPKVITMALDIYTTVVFFSHDIAFQRSFVELLMFMNKHIKEHLIYILKSFIGISIRLFQQAIQVSLPTWWSSPQTYLINCQVYANFKFQIRDWERLTVFS